VRDQVSHPYKISKLNIFYVQRRHKFWRDG
jgi:hypothetical protein